MVFPLLKSLYFSAKLLQVYAIVAVNGDIQHILFPYSQEICRLPYGVVPPGRHNDHSPIVAIVTKCALYTGHAETWEIPIRGKGLFPCHKEGGHVCQGSVGSDIAEGNAGILYIIIVEFVRLLKNHSMKPGHQLPFYKAGGLSRFYLDLVLVQSRYDHLEEDHEIWNSAGHVTDIIGVTNLDGVVRHFGFNLREHVLD